MTATNRSFARRTAILLLVPAFFVAGCQKQQQSNAPATHANLGGGKHQRLRGACADDIQKYCANADRLRRCLKENEDKLSESCKAAMAQRHGARNNGGSDQ